MEELFKVSGAAVRSSVAPGQNRAGTTIHDVALLKGRIPGMDGGKTP
jgi:hypothetical protein